MQILIIIKLKEDKIINFLVAIITFITKSLKNGAKGIFGIITAILDYITYAIFVKVFGFSIVVSNIISWIIAESFAFGTNKLFTYKGKGKKLVLKEYMKFLLARVFVLTVEIVVLKITVDILKFEELKMKLLAMFIVLIINSLLNRYVIFRKSKYISKVQLLKNIKNKLNKNKNNKKFSE